MQAERPRPEDLTQGLPTTSAKIRALGEAGYTRAEIARFLGIDYQHARKVLLDAGITGGARRVAKGDPPIPAPEEFRRRYLAFREKERRTRCTRPRRFS